MRVWVYPERAFEELGAERYQVSWEELKPSARKRIDAGEDCDLDSDLNYRVASYREKSDALKFAESLVKEGRPWFGEATVTRQVVGWFVEDDNVAEWQDTSEREAVA